MKAVESQQVSWWDVHTFVSPWLEVVGSWPTAGTPEWCALPDGDPAKIAALCDAAHHHALRIEMAQQAMAEASRDLSAATDWSAVSREIRQRNSFYAERPWLRRAAS
jgi:Protein of unknown function (DUF2742)